MSRMVEANSGRWQTLQSAAVVSPTVGWSLLAASVALLMWTALGTSLLVEPDTLWHIATGQWIAANGQWPRTDIFSYTFAGQPWIAKEWLSQLLLMSAHAVGGWPGVVILTAFAGAATLYIIMVNCGQGTKTAWGVLLGMIALQFLTPTLLARPHALVYPLVALWTLALARGAETRRPPWRALPLLVLWTNMHASFTIGLFIAAAMALEAILHANKQERNGVVLQWLAFGIACLAAGSLTPYGPQAVLVNFALAGGVESMPELGEWQPLGLSSSSVMMLIFGAVCILALARQSWRNAARILVLLVLAYAMIRHLRFVSLFGIVAPVLAGAALFELADTIGRRLNLFQTAILPKTNYTFHIASSIAAIAVIVPLLRSPQPLAAIMPVKALAAVPAELRAKHVFNGYNFGGYLISQGVKTFIDGRSDQLFLGGFMARAMAASRADDPELLRQLLDQHEVAWAIIEPTFPEARQFAKLAGWHLLHTDAVAQVYVRDGSGRTALIAKP